MIKLEWLSTFNFPNNEIIKALSEVDTCCEQSAWSPEYLEQLLSEENIFTLTAQDNSKTIVGWCLIRVILDSAEIYRLGVLPEFRRKGAGLSLLKELTQKTYSLSVKKIYLEVRSSNTGAINLYQKSGFKEKGIRKQYYSNPAEDALLLEWSKV